MIRQATATTLLLLSGLAAAHESSPKANVPGSAKAATAVVDRFFAALSSGDLAQTGALLDPNVVILESGGAEHSAAENLDGHAKGDAQFLNGAPHVLGRRTARAAGDVAWVASESELHTTIGIGQLAKRSGVPIHTVRHYERIRLLKPAVRLASAAARLLDLRSRRSRNSCRLALAGMSRRSARRPMNGSRTSSAASPSSRAGVIGCHLVPGRHSGTVRPTARARSLAKNTLRIRHPQWH